MSVTPTELNEAVETVRVASAPANAEFSAEARAAAQAGHEAAIRTIVAALQEMVRASTSNSEYWDEVVDAVRYRLEDSAISGDLPPIRAARRYLRQAVTWRILDLVRRDEVAKRVRKEQEIARQAEEQQRRDAERRAQLWPLLERVFEAVLRSNEARYRPSIARAWASLKLIHEDGYTLRAALQKLEPETDDPAALERAEAALQKAHQRLRKQLIAEIRGRVATGRMAPDEGSDSERIVSTLRRRSPNKVNPPVRPA